MVQVTPEMPAWLKEYLPSAGGATALAGELDSSVNPIATAEAMPAPAASARRIFTPCPPSRPAGLTSFTPTRHLSITAIGRQHHGFARATSHSAVSTRRGRRGTTAPTGPRR